MNNTDSESRLPLRSVHFLLEIPVYIVIIILLFDLMMDKLEEQFRDIGTNSS